MTDSNQISGMTQLATLPATGGRVPVVRDGDATNYNYDVAFDLAGLKRGVGPLFIVIAGQSNALGANSGGTNPVNSHVHTWDAIAGTYVAGGQYNALPWTRAAPDGNGGNNNTALAAAHAWQEATKREVYVVLHAKSGTSLQDDWLAGQNLDASLDAKVTAALAALPGKTTIDCLIWDQGQEDDSRGYTYATHLTNLGTFSTFIRGRAWMAAYTPIMVVGLSDLHERYDVPAALREFPHTQAGWFYVDARGLATSDGTHFTGAALYHLGHDVIGQLLVNNIIRSPFYPFNPFYNRGNGRLTQSDTVAISTFWSLVGYECRTGGPGLSETFTGDGSTVAFKQTIRGTISTITVNGVTKVLTTDYTVAQSGNDRPIITFLSAPANAAAIVVTYGLATNGPSGLRSISWGYRCVANADHSLVGGYLCYAPAGLDYVILWGRGLIASVSGEAQFGKFAKYIDGSRLFQYGIGTTDSARKNALGVAAAGNVELLAPIGGTDPGQNEEITFRLTSTTNLRIVAKCSDGVVRVANVTVA